MTTTDRNGVTHHGDADQLLAERAADSATVLTGIITAGMLHTAGQPSKLPELLWPDADPELVREVWMAALKVGMWAGKFVTAPRWDPEQLARLHTALADAGWERMAHSVRTTMATAPSLHPTAAHPADREAERTRR